MTEMVKSYIQRVGNRFVAFIANYDSDNASSIDGMLVSRFNQRGILYVGRCFSTREAAKRFVDNHPWFPYGGELHGISHRKAENNPLIRPSVAN